MGSGAADDGHRVAVLDFFSSHGWAVQTVAFLVEVIRPVMRFLHLSPCGSRLESRAFFRLGDVDGRILRGRPRPGPGRSAGCHWEPGPRSAPKSQVPVTWPGRGRGYLVPQTRPF
jgi:hypothetical protein